MAIIESFSPITRGAGSPEGKVAAPVGSIYTDTAATNGAIRWVKTSGTDGTGWGVEYGDTGWRDITSFLINGWEADFVYIRRYNQTISLRYTGLTGASATSSRMMEIPAGFYTSRSRLPITGNGEIFTAQITSSGAFDLNTDFSVPSSVYWSQSNWVTVASWPPSLPGTPA